MQEGDAQQPTLPKDTVIRLSNLPYHFDDVPLRRFFSQFGRVMKVKVIRGSKTGDVQQVGYVQFEDADTARVVSRTMDGYIIFDKILKCELVEACHPGVFKRVVPHQKRDGEMARLNAAFTEEQFEQELSSLRARMEKRQATLDQLGVEYRIPAVIVVDILE